MYAVSVRQCQKAEVEGSHNRRIKKEAVQRRKRDISMVEYEKMTEQIEVKKNPAVRGVAVAQFIPKAVVLGLWLVETPTMSVTVASTPRRVLGTSRFP